MAEPLLPDAVTRQPVPEPVRQVKGTALAKADRAWRARVSGMCWAQVAQVSGYAAPEAAMKAVRLAYGRMPNVDRDEQRRLWRDRLEDMWVQAQADMDDRRPGAVTAAVRVAQAAAALDGLNEPTRAEVQVTETFELLVAELVRHDL